MTIINYEDTEPSLWELLESITFSSSFPMLFCHNNALIHREDVQENLHLNLIQQRINAVLAKYMNINGHMEYEYEIKLPYIKVHDFNVIEGETCVVVKLNRYFILKHWCEQNCLGKWWIQHDRIYFSDHVDTTLFKIMEL